MKSNSLSDQSDEVLVRLTLEQESHFFGYLVKRYTDYLYGLGMRLTAGNHALAREVSQQAFIKAYKYLHSFDATHVGLGKDNTKRFRNWLTGIATNCHTDLARTEAKYSELRERDFDEIANCATSDNHRNQLSEFEEMIRPLNTQERQLMTLRFVYEFNINEIAGMMELNSGTVKSKISRTVSKLREQLSQTDVKQETN